MKMRRAPGPDEQPSAAPVAQPVHGVLATAGNAAMSAAIQRSALARKPKDPLTQAQVDAALAAQAGQAGKFDANAIRIVQGAVRAPISGTFDAASAQAVARFQGPGGSGIVDQQTMEQIFGALVSNGRQDAAIHLAVTWGSVATTLLAFSLRYDAQLTTDIQVTPKLGGLQVIEVGPSALVDLTTASTAVGSAFTGAITSVPQQAPKRLTQAEAQAAAAFNQSKIDDFRSEVTLQALLPGAPMGMTEDMAQFIAEFQATNLQGVAADGMISDATLHEITTRLIAGGNEDAAVQLLIDYHDLGDEGVLDVSVDLSRPDDFIVDYDELKGPARVHIGQAAFNQGHAGLVHVIAHALTEAKAVRYGVGSQYVRNFLGARREILSIGMDEENFTAPGGKGFVEDADEALYAYQQMGKRDKKQMWKRFDEVRDKVHMRFMMAKPSDQKAHAKLLADYDAQHPPS